MAKQTNQITVLGATAIGVGGMMGAGLYTLLGLATKSAGQWLPISFLIGGLVALFSVYSYAKLGIKYPSRGGAAQFLLKSFGDGLLAGGLNVFQYLGWIVAIALYATGFAEYACQLLGQPAQGMLGKLISLAIILLVVIINLLGSDKVAKAQTTIITIELIILFGFLALGVTHLHLAATSFKVTANPLVGVCSAAAILYVTYEGFGVVTNAAGNMKDPVHELPRAMYWSLGIVMGLYLLVSTVVVLTLGVSGAIQNQGHVLATTGKLLGGHLGMIAISIAALVATASAVNSTMFGDENLGLRIAKTDEIPTSFGLMTAIGGTWGLFVTALLAAIFVIIFPLAAVGQMASLTFLLVYAMVSVGHLRVRQQTGAKLGMLIGAISFNLILFLLLFIQNIVSGHVLTWSSVLGLLVLSFILEWAWRKHTGQVTAWIGQN